MMGVVHGHDESFKLWIKQNLHPRKLTTGYPKMEVWKMNLLFKGAICNGSLPPALTWMSKMMVWNAGNGTL